jgi:gamma-glutamyltranspeptidase
MYMLRWGAVAQDGNVVEMTQTINGLFGCGAMVPGTGILLNNTQNMFDPHPGMPHSVAPVTLLVNDNDNDN